MGATIIAGVDVSAETFDVTVIDFDTERRYLGKTYSNDVAGIEQCIAEIAAEGLDLETVLFCMEYTGVYSDVLSYVLAQKGLTVAMAVPEKVRRAAEDPHHKSDQLDSVRLAEYAWRYADRLRTWKPNEAVVEQIQVLLVTREQLVKQRTASKNMLRALRRKWIQTKPANDALALTIAHHDQQIDELERQIRQLIKTSPALVHGFMLLTSIPGVATLLAATMVVLTDGFTNLRTYPRLAAYLGIAPRPYQSGTSVDKGCHARGYGPSIARKLLYLSACTCRRSRGDLRLYYERKKAQGKPGRLILNNIANKQLRLMCAILEKGQPYIQNYRSTNPQLLTKP